MLFVCFHFVLVFGPELSWLFLGTVKTKENKTSQKKKIHLLRYVLLFNLFSCLLFICLLAFIFLLLFTSFVGSYNCCLAGVCAISRISRHSNNIYLVKLVPSKYTS